MAKKVTKLYIKEEIVSAPPSYSEVEVLGKRLCSTPYSTVTYYLVRKGKKIFEVPEDDVFMQI